MACPTCDHTMQRVGITDSREDAVFHCSRCGTIKTLGGVIVPSLVTRCQRFRKLVEGRSLKVTLNELDGMGITESIQISDPDQADSA